MNWLKTKMGSHGWDLTDDDVKKPNILFLGPIKFATQELEDFEEYFTVKYHEGNREELIRKCKKGKYDGYAAILWNPTTLYNNVDVEACTAKGVLITNTPGVVSGTAADTAMFLILGCLRNFTMAQTNLRQGKWLTGLPTGRDLGSKIIGIVGLGRVGKAIAKRANAFGMVVNYYNKKRLDVRVEGEYNVQFVAYETLLRESDVIVICVPFNASTKHLINTEQFDKMRKGVVFINVSQGPVVNESALVAALNSGK
ncbi:hypothetical protein BGZ46_000167, partial [Entomortierella lignicola]